VKEVKVPLEQSIVAAGERSVDIIDQSNYFFFFIDQ
jgi:hypothetical protein